MSHKSFRPLASLFLALALALAGVVPAYAAPPLNDFFSDAEEITALNFSATVDATEAGTEGGENFYCYYAYNTVWYKFTPTQTVAVRVDTSGSPTSANVSVFRAYSPSIYSLSFIGCGAFGNPVTVLLQAGETYYFQVGGISGIPGFLTLNAEEYVPPPPEAGFYNYPFEPSIYATTQFCDQSYDPAGFGFNSYSWDFGDGATADTYCAYHQYAQDGTYTVTHTATTIDGRVGTVARDVQVRTHDVSIIRVSAPRTANAGQTRTISIAIRNTRYAETVRIDLYKSIAGGGFEYVGSSTQYVPVRNGNRTSDFVFNYTFTPADAQIGKVTFRVEVSLLTSQDAFPADNQGYSSPPTTVR